MDNINPDINDSPDCTQKVRCKGTVVNDFPDGRPFMPLVPREGEEHDVPEGKDRLEDCIPPDSVPIDTKKEFNDENASWIGDLIQGKKGPLLNLANVRRALHFAPEFNGSLTWDSLAQNIVFTRKTPIGGPGPAEDHSVANLAIWMQEQGFNAPHPLVGVGAFTEARNNSFHPVRQYLKGLKWDGTPRIKNWLGVYACAVDDAYTSAVGKKWLISAVARAMKPGCKADCMLRA